MSYTSWNINTKPARSRQCLADRLEHARRLRALLAETGLKFPQAAQHLHVSLRTLHNWLNGTHQIPPMVFRLLRLERCLELPGADWAGWHFSRGCLVTPEGRSIEGYEGAWWSLLVRQARSVAALREQLRLSRAACAVAEIGAVRRTAGAASPAEGAPPRGEKAGERSEPLNLSTEHYSTRNVHVRVVPAVSAINPIAKTTAL